MINRDNIREYAMAAFIRYFKLGCPSRSDYEAQIKRVAGRKYSGEDYEKELRRSEPLLLDIDAVDKTLRYLRGEISPAELTIDLQAPQNGPCIADAICSIYAGMCREKPSPVRMVDRVRRYATTVAYADERTVYRWLKRGCRIFAHIRGLVLDNND